MQELIDVIRTAIAADASNEQKAAGVQACNTIAAALGTVPGQQLVLPGTAQRSPLSGISFDQVLDLAIAKLTALAHAHDAQVDPALPSQSTTRALSAPTRSGLRIPAPVAIPPHIMRPADVARSPKSARPANLTRPPTRPPNVARPVVRSTSPKNP